MKKIKIFLTILFCVLQLKIYAQQAYVAEYEMNTVFASGGYGALFGAAMGAASLPFMSGSPLQNLRVVAGGASIGFMIGSAYGFYNIVSSNRNSYFNYNLNQEEDGGTYYSMPPTAPTQGNNIKKENSLQDKNNGPMIGALLMGDVNHKINLGVPYFWVGNKEVAVMLAYLTF